MEELLVTFDDGNTVPLLFKNASRHALLGDAGRVKPAFLHDPHREIATYRTILSPCRLGTPVYHGALVDDTLDRYWLFLELVPAWRLTSFQEPRWRQAARWLAAMHARFQGAPGLREMADEAHLLRYDGDFYRQWARRAMAFAQGDPSAGAAPRRRALRRLVQQYDRVVDRLVALPPTFLHGEFFGSNILVRHGSGGGDGICPVDWETAAVGPGPVDLAALISGGWCPEERDDLVEAYRTALLEAGGQPDEPGEFRAAVDTCQLHLAMQYLGWSGDWAPPARDAVDWGETALRLAEAMGLL